MMRLRACLLLIPLLLSSAAAQNTPAARARVADAYGKAEKRQTKSDTRWTPVSNGDLLGPDASIRTGDNAAVILVLPDGHSFRIGENSEVLLKEVGQNRSYSFQLLKGEVWSFVNKAKKPAKYEIETPSTVLGVSGTLFSVEHDTDDNESEITVEEGVVAVRQGKITHQLRKGFMTRLRRGQVDPAKLEKHSDLTRQMWQHLQKSENWTKGADAPKLDRQAEQRLRNLRQAQKQLRLKLLQQQQQRDKEREQARGARQQPAKQDSPPATPARGR